MSTAESMGGIINHTKSVPASNSLNPFHLASMSPSVHTDDAGSPRSDERFNSVWIDVVSLGINVAKHWSNALPLQCVGCCDKCEGRHNDFACKACRSGG